ncbi:MAG: hypothetical protein H6549_11215 [Chitinophagales bacterium]|nr:hypothetical protein [Chitinophagales bacterium]
MKIISVISIVILMFSACREGKIKRDAFEQRNELIHHYILLVDSLGRHDNSSLDYKVLIAFSRNDTSYLKKVIRDINSEIQGDYFSRLKPCITPFKLDDTNADIAYRFTHSEPFCLFGQTITIAKYSDSIILNYQEYIIPDFATGKPMTYVYEGKEIKIDSNCVLMKDFWRRLTVDDWEKLEKALYKTDYWGMKQYSPKLLFDPSQWQVAAYSKEPFNHTGQRYYFVSRETAWPESYGKMCLLFMELAGEKGMCNK